MAEEKPDTVRDPHPDHVTGYPKLAARMQAMPPAAMFRRFGALNARNLLFFQNELQALEEELKEIETADNANQQSNKWKYAIDYWWLENSADGDDGDTEQIDLVLKLRKLLKQYNNAIIQQATILQLKEPDIYDIENLQLYLASRPMGGLALVGPDYNIWGNYKEKNSHSYDLISLSPRQGVDTFSRWLTSKIIDWIDILGLGRFKKVNPRYGSVSIRDRSVFKATLWFTSVLASVIPIMSILVLDRLQTKSARIGTVAGFNILIALCLVIFTEAKRAEVFAVTTSFAAIQIFFVGTANYGPSELPCHC